MLSPPLLFLMRVSHPHGELRKCKRQAVGCHFHRLYDPRQSHCCVPLNKQVNYCEEHWIRRLVLFSTAFTIPIKVQEQEGLGQHVWDLGGIDQTYSLKVWTFEFSTLNIRNRLTAFVGLYASIMMYYLSLAFIKISILVRYYRIFNTSHMRKALFIVGPSSSTPSKPSSPPSSALRPPISGIHPPPANVKSE